MRCFNHSEIEAVGTCKACGKGLCKECAADLGHGLACNPTHVEKVETLNSLINRNIKVTGINKRGVLVMPIFFAFMGLGFLVSGLITNTKASPFSTFMGVGFVVFAIVTYLINRKAWAK